MKTELVTFAVKLGMEREVEGWLDLLQKRRDECVETLRRERMRYECIFKSQRDDRLYLTWFSVQAPGGAAVESSPFEIDRLHLEYWEKCIDLTVSPESHEHAVTFAPQEVDRVMLAESPT